MASGVAVDLKCKEEFGILKLKKCYRYIIFKLNEKMTEVVVCKKAERCATYEDLVEDLRLAQEERQCRFIIYDAEYLSTKGTGVMKEKMFFIYWGPDESTTKQKMVYSATKEAFIKELGDGLGKPVQANDMGDLEWDYVLEQISRYDKN